MPERITERLFVPAGIWSTHLVSTDQRESYGPADVAHFAEVLAQIEAGSLIFMLADTTVRSVSRFLQILGSGHPVALVDPGIRDDQLAALIERYEPEIVIDGCEGADSGISVRSRSTSRTHPDLSVLLTTSGTTGSAKFVRLSRQNIESNADQIIESLAITENDVAITVLPLHYSFGMSVITSHALAGADILVTADSVITPEFWTAMGEAAVTFLPVVPQSLSMLHRIGLERRLPESITVIAQAGGRADAHLLRKTWQLMHARGGRFHVMYGQTEASPRIACMPSEEFPNRPSSVGLAMKGGRISIEDGEVLYEGPNVMMGYAERRANLCGAENEPRVLRTGDLGYLDEEGFLHLTGRIKRIAKIASSRVSLDELEAALGQHVPGEFAVVARGDDGIRICIAHAPGLDATATRKACARALGIALTLIEVREVDALPLLSSGKIDYASLADDTAIR